MLNSQGSGVGAIDLHGINSWWRVVWVFMRLSMVLVGSGVYESFLFSNIWGILVKPCANCRFFSTTPH